MSFDGSRNPRYSQIKFVNESKIMLPDLFAFALIKQRKKNENENKINFLCHHSPFDLTRNLFLKSHRFLHQEQKREYL